MDTWTRLIISKNALYMKKLAIAKIIITAVFVFVPLRGVIAQEQNFLNQNRWVEFLKQNVTIPFTVPQGGEKLPTPEEALKKFSPSLQEINKGVQEETGVDFAKFLRWLTKVFTAIFRIITNVLKTFADALGS